MNPPENAAPPSLSLADIYHVLFRRKKIVIAGLIVGVAAAAYVYLSTPKVFESQAEIMVHYVVDNESHGLYRDATVKDPDVNGAAVINNELEILTSYNLALEVASNIGPKEILSKADGGTNLDKAAAFLRDGLKATVVKNTDDILLTFEHRDAALVQPVLTSVIDTYLRHHKDIHRAGDNEDTLQQAADRAQADVKLYDEQLIAERNKAQIISVEDQKKSFADQLNQVDLRLNAAMENLQQRHGASNYIEQMIMNPALARGSAANPVSATNAASPVGTNLANNGTTASSTATNLASAPVKRANSEQTALYRRLNASLESLRKDDMDLEIQQHFTLENPRRKYLAQKIADYQSQVSKMEADYPDLVGIAPLPVPGNPSSTPGSSQVDPFANLRTRLQSESIEIAALEQDIKALIAQRAAVLRGVTNLSSVESTIADLQRKKANAEQDYASYSTRLKQDQFEQNLGSGKTSNLTIIDHPTPPMLHVAKTLKAAGMAFIVCLGGALALAFALELYFDRSLKHSKEINARLAAPCMLSIPYMNGDAKLGFGANIRGLLPRHGGSESQSQSPVISTEQDIADIAEKDSRFQVFYEALRDRLIAYFEDMNFTHKPKLIAVTACHTGAGTTKIAAGLAASLSTCREGKVLLVDMHEGNSQTHQFYKGKLASKFDDVLQGDAPPEQVQENLFVVRGNPAREEKFARALPKQFTNLLPMMKSSDYDYIIFDMPPVSQISITPRLAGFMDMVLLVVEAEKTDRDAASRAVTWLTESKANIAVVLNKKRSYVPSRLLPEM